MSLEKSCEDVELLLLAGQSDLTAYTRVNYDDDSDANKDRIIVKSEPRQVALPGHDGATVRQWMIPVSVTIKLATKSATQMDTVIAAVNAANNTGPAPTDAVTLSQSSFSGGPRIENMPEGERESEDKTRQYTARFAFYVSP